MSHRIEIERVIFETYKAAIPMTLISPLWSLSAARDD